MPQEIQDTRPKTANYQATKRPHRVITATVPYFLPRKNLSYLNLQQVLIIFF